MDTSGGSRKKNGLEMVLLLLLLVLVVVSDGGSDDDDDTRRRMDLMMMIQGEGEEEGPSPSPSPLSNTTTHHLIPVNLNSNNNNNYPPPPPSPLTTINYSSSEEQQEQQQHRIDVEKCLKEDSSSSSSSTNNCTINASSMIIACLLPPPIANTRSNLNAGLQEEFYLLIQNEGDIDLDVTITFPSSITMDIKDIQIPKHRSKKVNVLVNTAKPSSITLNSGSGKCTIQTAVVPKSQGNNIFSTLPHMPSFTTLASPIYGAYLLFVIALIVGGSWACCKFGKRGQQHGRGEGVAYQELEMGSSSSIVNVETADGWDEGWDDEWDEERAVKSPGGAMQTGNLSANGMTSKTSSRDVWGNDWDD